MNMIVCPHCHEEINVDEVLAHQIKEGLSAQFEKEKQVLKKEYWQRAQEEAQKRAVEAQNKAVQDLEQKLKEQATAAAAQAVAAQKQVEKQAAFAKEQEARVKEQEQRVKEQEARALKAEQKEVELRQQQRQLEERERQLKLQVERELDDRLKIEQEKLLKIESERTAVREREHQKQLADMQAALEEARRKATTVSQQLQGESMELRLEDVLRQQFPMDTIAEVKKGQFGADVLQTVRDSFGRSVGIIVWESKQTEHFSDKWLPKLRQDTRESHGSVAVLVTRTLPEDVQTAGEREGVWITNLEFVLPLATLLRQTLIKVQQEKTAQSGKDVKTEMLFHYIHSAEFRGRVEGIVESFHEMRGDLEREQRALQNSWKKREKQILRLATNTAYMYGELQGLLGASLPTIRGLEIESGAGGDMAGLAPGASSAAGDEAAGDGQLEMVLDSADEVA